jgi:hypothetical protein
MPRKSSTREFKLQALKMVTEQGLSVAEAARPHPITTADRLTGVGSGRRSVAADSWSVCASAT